MKNFFIFVTVASLAPALLLACASGGGDGLGGGGSGGTGPSKTSSPSSTVGGQTNTVAVTSSSTGGGCGACNINSDCTNTCAAAPAGESNCCDTQNHMCYLNQQPSCPVQATSSSASTGTSMY